jgi:3-phenylpropionate/trans-cinnamate dioxygenase ferredoxin component
MATDAREAAESAGAEPFVSVAQVSDIAPGTLLRVEVDGRLICLANVDGAIYAFDDDCPHIGGPLDEGDLEGHVLTCPIHLAQFDVRSGRVLRGPASEHMRMYPVRIEGGQVLISVRE